LFGCSSAFPWNGGKLPGLAVYKEVGVQRTPSFDNLKLLNYVGFEDPEIMF